MNTNFKNLFKTSFFKIPILNLFYCLGTWLYEHFLETIFTAHIKRYFNDTLGLDSYFHVKNMYWLECDVLDN